MADGIKTLRSANIQGNATDLSADGIKTLRSTNMQSSGANLSARGIRTLRSNEVAAPTVAGPIQHTGNPFQLMRDAENRLAEHYKPDYRLGNIDIRKDPVKGFTGKRYTVYNDVRTGENVVIPAAKVNAFGIGVQLSEEEAVKQYLETGQYYGKFKPALQEKELTEYLHELELEAQKWRLKKGIDTYSVVDDLRDTENGWAEKQNLVLDKIARTSEVGDPQKESAGIKASAHESLLYDQELDKMREKFGESSESAIGTLGLATASGLSSFTAGFGNALHGTAELLGGRSSGSNDIGLRRSDALKQVAAEERSEMGTAQGIIFDMTQSFAQNAPSMAINAVSGGILGTALTFASTYGNELYYAKKAGADKKAAVTYAFLDGLAQAYLDYLGYLPGVSTVTKGAANALAKNVSNATIKFIGRLGINGIGEFVTEDLQTVIENGLRNAAFGEQNETSIFSEEALYSGFLGMLSAGTMDGISTTASAVANRAEITKIGHKYLGDNAKVKEALGIGLANAKSSEIYRTAQNLERKFNNNETISAYELGKLVADSQTKKAILAREIERFALESARENGLDPESGMVQDVAFVASRFGRPVRFVSDRDIQGTGEYDPTTGVISLNAGFAALALKDETRAQDLVNYVLKHELAHSAERTKLGGQLEKIVRSSMGAQFDTAVQEKIAEYQRYGKPLSEADAKHEVVAHWLGKNLYQNGFAQAVVNGDAKVGNVILRTLDQVRLALGGTQKSRTAANIAIVERLFMRALEQSPALDSNGGVRFSFVGVGKDGRRKYESGFGDDVPMETREKLFKERIATIFNLGAVELRTDVKKIVVNGDRFTAKKNLRGDAYATQEEFQAKINALYDLADILQTSEYLPDKTQKEQSYEDSSIPPKNDAHKGVKYWYKFQNKIELDGTPYTVTFNIRDKGKEQYQYLIDFKKEGHLVNHTTANSLRQAYQVPIDTNVPQNGGGVNTQYMQNNAKNSQSSFEGSDDIAEALALMEQSPALDGHGDVQYSVDNSPEIWDNKNKANTQGDFVNEYYDALTPSEWSVFYKRLEQYGYIHNRRIGATVAVVINDKLIVARREFMNQKRSHDFVVIDAYQVRGDGESHQVLWNIQQLFDKGEFAYDVNGRVYRQFCKLAQSYEPGAVLGRYGREHHQYAYSDSQGAETGNGYGVYQNRGEGTARSRFSLGNQPSVQSNNGILNTNNTRQQESPTSQDGAGFFHAQNEVQSSFEGSDDIAEALALMEREQAEKAAVPVEENDTLPLSRQSPTDPLTRSTEGDVQDAGVTPATDIPNPLESGRALELTQSNAQTVDELTAEIGEEAVYCRMYNAAQIERPPSTMEINGQTVDTVAYMDELFLSLPDDDLQLTAYLKEKEAAKAAQLAEQFSRGETGTEWTELDLQIQTARSKLEWSALEDSGESGKKVRRFYEQRLKGKDVNKAHETELLELLAGRNETYSPIANQKTLEQAKDKLRNAEYQTKLQKRILRYKPNDLFNAVDAAAAQVMINDARNSGDLELYADLVQGLSRKGTELGRAVQVLSMQRRMTPEGTLKAAQRTFHKQADKMIYDGANEDLDTFSAHVVDAIERATENKAATTSGDNQQYVQQGGEAVHNPMTREELTDALARDIAGDNSPYITADEIRGILERAVDNASDIPDQLRRHLKKKLGKDMGTLAQRIETLQQAGHLNDATMRRVMEETLGLPTLSTEDVATLTELVNEMNRAAPDSAEQLEATESIYRFLGGKLAVDLFDTIQAWRKFGMLFNIKTHLRNIGSNAVFAGVNRLDSATETILEHVFSRYLNQEQRTAAFGWSFTEHGRQIRPIVEQSARQALLRLQGQGQKYEISNGVLEQYRKVFGTKKVGEALNKTNEWNSRWLEKEDAKFFLPAYTNALGQIMTARGLTEVTTEAADLAFQRASESVFRGENAMTDVFTSLKRYQNSTNTGRRLFGYAVDIAIPFTKTPANIAYQAVEHSPIGVVKGALDLFQATRGKGSKDVAGAINTISKGVTGSALMAIGMLLGSAGLFVTGFGKTEKERAADELAGIQENAFRFGNVTISLDWLQPAASPLIVGASIGQRLQEDGLSLGSVFGAVFDGTDSLFEMTMLQSLYDVLGGYNAGASASVASVAENLLSQSIPTAVGQVARAVDPVQRKTNGESKLSSVIGTGTFAKIIQKIMARVPGLTYLLEPELDVWGNTVYRTGKASTASGILNALQQFILPANVKIATGNDEISQIVMALYNSDEQQTGRAIPTAITREKAADMGVSYEDANRLLGQNQHAALLSILQDREKYTVTQTISRGGKSVKQKRQKYWSDMTDEERLQVLKKVYQSEKDNITDPDGEYYDEIVRRMN